MAIIWFILIVGAVIVWFMNKNAWMPSVMTNKWWERVDASLFGYPSYSYWEAFSNPAPLKPLEKEESPLLEYPPNGPSPADVYTEHPYHLLGDILPAASNKSIALDSRSCYASDFEKATAKTGNYRQLTNNYKREYPDSCNSLNQDLLMKFYKST